MTAEMYSDALPTDAETVLTSLFLNVINDLIPQWLASITPSIYLSIHPTTLPPLSSVYIVPCFLIPSLI